MKAIKMFLVIVLIYGVLGLYYPPSLIVSIPLGSYILFKGLKEDCN